MMALTRRLAKTFGRLGVIPAMIVLLGACQTTLEDTDRQDLIAEAARMAEMNHDYPGAIARYSNLYETNRDDPLLILALARNLRYAGQTQDALNLINDGLARLGPQVLLLTEKGKIEIAGGRADLAVQTLLLAKAQDPKDWQPPAVLGVAYDRIGQYDEAAANYRLSLAINPANVETLNNFALSRGLAGDLPEALTLARQAVAMPGASKKVRDNLALLESLAPPAAGQPLIPRRLPEAEVMSVPPAALPGETWPPRPPKGRSR